MAGAHTCSCLTAAVASQGSKPIPPIDNQFIVHLVEVRRLLCPGCMLVVVCSDGLGWSSPFVMEEQVDDDEGAVNEKQTLIFDVVKRRSVR